MCEANAYFIDENGKEDVFMKEVDIILPSGDGKYLLKDIYGTQKFIKGNIREISLLNHKVVFEGS